MWGGSVLKNKLGLFFVLLTTVSFSQVKSYRWTYQEDKNSNLKKVIAIINEKSGLELTEADFKLTEERSLATSHFQMFSQVSGDYPIRGQLIRIWSRLDNRETIQVEAHVDKPVSSHILRFWKKAPELSSETTLKLVRRSVKEFSEDPEVREVRWIDEWLNGQFVRTVQVKSRRGLHKITLSHQARKIIERKYETFPFSDSHFSLPAQVYPIWEEYENIPANLEGRISSELKYLNNQVRQAGENPYSTLQKEMRYFEHKYDPIKGLTEEGRKEGFWAMSYVKTQARQIFETLPLAPNQLSSGVRLEGKYATVNFHPSVLSLQGVQFPLTRSSQFRPNWVMVDPSDESMEMIPDSGILGRPILSKSEVLNRPARRLPDHSVVDYINDGFDEIQVYWAVTQLFDSLRPMGFTDPELSTRPFHAYLYDTDISMKDNAYYTDDTINFTTYSGKSHNMARDNSTIWHELGHGVMDRLMGDHLVLADTGGLSEGIADFVAELVMKEVTKGKEFPGSSELRIRNRTGFFLTNESHDDGEAYGGTLYDILEEAMRKEGLLGLKKVTDLTLEAMRLTRNHPGLTASQWFQHILFADELGNPPIRKPGELRNMILASLQGRNFSWNENETAQYSLFQNGQEITSSSLGSRSLPLSVKLSAKDTQEFPMTIKLKNSKTYQFRFPVTVKVQLRKGPIQGAIQWEKESDEPLEYILQNEDDELQLPLSVKGTCDEVNRPDGSCVDYAYVQIWNQGETEEPQAKKRFYVRVIPQ